MTESKSRYLKALRRKVCVDRFCVCCVEAPFLAPYPRPLPLQARRQLLQQGPPANGAQGGREAGVFKEAADSQALFLQGLVVLFGEL